MQDDCDNLSIEQNDVPGFVQEKYTEHMQANACISIEISVIEQHLCKLKIDYSPGCDGIMVEHILYSKSHTLLKHIICALCFTRVPIFKKSTLDLNQASSYRPITISSRFAKLTELLMVPDQVNVISDSQYGFTEGGDTVLGSPIYTCSLGREKCFDKIWHNGLFRSCGAYFLLTIGYSCAWFRSSNAKVK